MKRVAAVVALVSLLVVSFGFGVVQAKSPPTSQTFVRAPGAVPASVQARKDLKSIGALAPGVTVCANVSADSDVSKLIDCLNKVTKFAKATQNELSALDKFVNKFFRCTIYGTFTIRGTQPGTAGYFFDLGDGTIVKHSAVDLAEVGTDSDIFVTYHLRPTETCLAFAQII